MTDPATRDAASAPPVGRVALVTGGAGTLGRAIAQALLDGGAFDRVLAPGRAELDVTSPESVAAYFSGIDRIDLLVNNAGVTRDAPMLRLDEVDWDVVVDTHLRGAFLCSRAALRPMIRQRSGHIVQIGSFSALRPPSGQAAYAAAKAGLIGLTQSLAEEVGGRQIRVNCVLPGFLEETGMTRDLSAETVERARQAHVLGRFNTAADAGRFIAFLDTLPAVSGQVFQIDSRLRRW